MFRNFGLGWLPYKPVEELKVKKHRTHRKTYLDHGTRHTNEHSDDEYVLNKHGKEYLVLVPLRGY